MKAAGPILLWFVVTGAFAAEETPALSGRLKAEVRANLPAYTPPPPKPQDTPTAIAGPSDPDVLVLPKLTVREKVQPRIEPNDLLTPAALNKKFARDYKNSLQGLDSLLNGFSLPLFGPSLAARGYALQRQKQFQELNQMIEAGNAGDAKTTTELKQAAADMHRANDWQKRVVGDAQAPGH